MDRIEALGKVLRQLREDKGLTQLVVADRALMSSTFVSQVENHVKEFRMSTFLKLCDALNVPASEVLRQAEAEVARHKGGRARPVKTR